MAALNGKTALVTGASRGVGRASVEIGHVDAIFRYPVKSMRGERL